MSKTYCNRSFWFIRLRKAIFSIPIKTIYVKKTSSVTNSSSLVNHGNKRWVTFKNTAKVKFGAFAVTVLCKLSQNRCHFPFVWSIKPFISSCNLRRAYLLSQKSWPDMGSRSRYQKNWCSTCGVCSCFQSVFQRKGTRRYL